MLGFRREVIRSSSLNIDSRIKAQQRIIEIARRVGATQYINAPGGRDLYNEEAFKEAGLTLNFLPDYQGGFLSTLERIILNGTELVAEEINKNLVVKEVDHFAPN